MNGYYHNKRVTGEEITPTKKRKKYGLQGARLPGQHAQDRRPLSEQGISLLPQGISLSTGCRVYPDCLTCPLPQCIYDEPLVTQVFKAGLGRVFELHDQGYSVSAMSRITGYSRLSLRDILQHQRGNIDKEYTENEFLLELKS